MTTMRHSSARRPQSSPSPRKKTPQRGSKGRPSSRGTLDATTSKPPHPAAVVPYRKAARPQLATASIGIICFALVPGCSSALKWEPQPLVFHEREALVQSIPRGAWVERNGEYLGVAPVSVRVRTYENGAVARPVRVRVTDISSGAWEQKVWAPGDQWPEKILFDLRPWLPVPQKHQ